MFGEERAVLRVLLLYSGLLYHSTDCTVLYLGLQPCWEMVEDTQLMDVVAKWTASRTVAHVTAECNMLDPEDRPAPLPPLQPPRYHAHNRTSLLTHSHPAIPLPFPHPSQCTPQRDPPPPLGTVRSDVFTPPQHAP